MEERSPIKCGCVSTVRLPYSDKAQKDLSVQIINSFVSYHLGIGFSHIILFFDDENDTSRSSRYLQSLSDTGTVKIFVRGKELDAMQRAVCSLYDKLCSFKDSEVPARQQLNAEFALVSTATTLGLSWLLHIDIDELFYISNNSIHSHFEELMRRGIGHITYANHEGIPETRNIGNYFEEVTLFRRNQHTLPMTSKTLDGMKWLERRTKHGQYMLFYDNGKSAVRVEDGVVPVSVHAFELQESSELRYAQTFHDLRNPRPETVYLEDEDAHILVSANDMLFHL